MIYWFGVPIHSNFWVYHRICLFLLHSKLFRSKFIQLIKEIWVMLAGASGALVKEANIVILHWNLCSQLIKNLKNIFFNLKFSFVGFLSRAGHRLTLPRNFIIRLNIFITKIIKGIRIINLKYKHSRLNYLVKNKKG